jgi:hypothetical protein
MKLFAYIDPGLGLLLWQALVAACLGLLFYLKKTRRWLGNLFLKPFRTDKKLDNVPDKSKTVPE